MKILKPVYITGALAVSLIGCKSVSTIPVPKGTSNSVNISAKKGALTQLEKEMWGHADLATDTIPGMSVAKAYAFLEGKKGVDVVVGVVDSGTDLKHEDLAANAWVNTKEIPNNGKDDDKNGYIDDINGWNFLGSIYKENLEAERILMNPSIVEDAVYQEVKAAQDKKTAGAKNTKKRFTQMLGAVKMADGVLSKYLNKKDYTADDVNKIQSDDPSVMQVVSVAKQMYGFGTALKTHLLLNKLLQVLMVQYLHKLER